MNEIIFFANYEQPKTSETATFYMLTLHDDSSCILETISMQNMTHSREHIPISHRDVFHRLYEQVPEHSWVSAHDAVEDFHDQENPSHELELALAV